MGSTGARYGQPAELNCVLMWGRNGCSFEEKVCNQSRRADVRVVAREQVAEASGSDVLMAVDLTVVSDSECNLDYEEGETTEPIIPLDQVGCFKPH